MPDDAQKYDLPYYRDNATYGGGDRGWTHGAIAAGFASAKLSISAFDVDCFDLTSGELDEIFAKDDGNWVSLGYLASGSDIWAFTEFVLGANFFDGIAAGLDVRMEIDKLSQGWAVTLARSVITTDGAAPPPPEPGIIPLSAADWMMIAGLGGLAALHRRKRV